MDWLSNIIPVSQGNNTTNNSIRNFLIRDKHISLDYLKDPEELISFDKDKMCIKLKNLYFECEEEKFAGTKTVYINGSEEIQTNWGEGFFYDYEINRNTDFLVVEWEIDWLTIAGIPFFGNIIGLPTIDFLPWLLDYVSNRTHGKNNQIYLFLNNKIDTDTVMRRCIWEERNDKICLKKIHDCRPYLWKYQTINEYILDENSIDCALLIKKAVPISEFEFARINNPEYIKERFLRVRDWVLYVKDHNNVARYIMINEIIGCADENIFKYDKEEKLWKPINRKTLEQIIIRSINRIIPLSENSFRRNDKDTIMNFLMTIAENADLKKALNEKKDSFCLYFNDGMTTDIENLSINEFREYEPKDYVFSKLKYNYMDIVHGNYLESETWYKYLNDIISGDTKTKQEIIDTLQEFAWYCLIPSTKLEKALMFFGTGGNGKTIFLETIKYLVWEENCSSIGIHEMSKDQNINLIFGKMVNIDSDMENGAFLDQPQIKKIISWESLTGKSVYHNPLSFRPFCKLLLATNAMPSIRNVDQSIKRRFIFVPLKNCFIGKEDIYLKDKLKDEIQWIFARALVGLQRLIRRWGFDIPTILTEEMDSFIHENDSVKQFLDSDLIKTGEELFIGNDLLYKIYTSFCKDSWFKPETKRRITSKLDSMWFKRDRISQGRWLRGLGVMTHDINDIISETL